MATLQGGGRGAGCQTSSPPRLKTTAIRSGSVEPTVQVYTPAATDGTSFATDPAFLRFCRGLLSIAESAVTAESSRAGEVA